MNSIETPKDKSIEMLAKQERATALYFVLTAVFFVPAALVAVFSGSILLCSDLVDYGRVFCTTLIAWNILRAIRTGKAQGFDYGTGKLQTIGGMFGSGIYLAALVFMAGMAVHRLINPTLLNTTASTFGLFFLSMSFLGDSWLWFDNRRLAQKEHSPLMEMLWRANRADALSALVLFFGLLLPMLLRNYAWSVYLDPILALAFIVYVAISFLPGLAEGLNELLDKTLQEELQIRIDRRLAENFSGYAGFHGVRSRRAGGRIFIEVALSFSPEQSVGKAMETVAKLSRDIQADIPGSEVRITLMPVEKTEGKHAED
ncbi:MAG: hypothetical protein A2X49_16645 [Lentisphaerae bacterium GWF2_52_8]|nr:MAG: hypothetical protein A2X49_16645 [Lentisphaerae bacterium GWF2_52_8]